MKLKVVINPESGGGYSIAVPALPGCFSDADTLEEARVNAREAAECWLDGARESEVRRDEDAAVDEQLREWLPGESPLRALIEEIDVAVEWERAAR